MLLLETHFLEDMILSESCSMKINYTIVKILIFRESKKNDTLYYYVYKFK